MKKTVTLDEFRNDFVSIRPDNFSYEGLEALFNYLENLEEDCGVEIEFDVIALCCDYTEYGSLEEYNQVYSKVESIEEIEELTIRIDDERFIIQG